LERGKLITAAILLKVPPERGEGPLLMQRRTQLIPQEHPERRNPASNQ
jgi:hypothetical protein